MDHGKIGARIRQARIRADLRQVDVAAKTGIEQSTLSRIEKGLLKLSFEDAVAISKACGLRLTSLVRAGAA